MSEETKLCPYCAEEIKAAAIVCKHCGRDIQNSSGRGGTSNKKIWDFLGNPTTMLVSYLVGAIILSIIGIKGSALPILFGILFVIYYFAYHKRRSLLSEEEKKAEDDYQNWLSSRRP